MYHIPILLFGDQDIATPPRTLPESDKRSYKLCQFIDTSRYLSLPLLMWCFWNFFRLNLIANISMLFFKAPRYWRRQKMNPNIRKIDILCNVTNKKFARHFENHRLAFYRSKLSLTARIITKYSLERFLSIWGEKMSKGFLKFCKLISNLILGQIVVSKSHKREETK